MGEAGSLLAWLKDYLLRDSPMFIRRYNYTKCKQKPGERFDDWRTRKLIKAEECDLHKITKEDIQVTELICGISNQELRKEILKLGKEPKLEELVAWEEVLTPLPRSRRTTSTTTPRPTGPPRSTRSRRTTPTIKGAVTQEAKVVLLIPNVKVVEKLLV